MTKQEMVDFIRPYCNEVEYESNDKEWYTFHIEGDTGAECPCVVDKDGQTYKIVKVEDNIVHFIRYLRSRMTPDDPFFFACICGPSWWHIDLNQKEIDISHKNVKLTGE